MSSYIREHFPFLCHPGKTGLPVAYLDTAASAQKPRCVLETMTNVYETAYANVHRGLYDLAHKATEHFEQARVSVQKFLGAPCPEEIIFTRNTTEAINLVASSFLTPSIQAGDEIILSMMEHHANILPWHFLRERYGAKLVWIPIDDQGLLDMQALEALFSKKTRLLALTHMSNVLGTFTPLEKIITLAHAHDVPVLVDGAQAAVHGPVDVQSLQCDFYTFTGHKVYGPTGIGVLYGKKEHLEAMIPYQGGGEMISNVSCDTIRYARLPYKFEAGTPAIVEAAGLKSALHFLQNIGWEAIQQHERALSIYLKEAMSSLKDVRFIGDVAPKHAIFSFILEGIHPHDVAMILNQYDVAIRAGHHCAQPLIEHFGIYATCRASLGLYNNREDIDRLIEALEKCLIFFKKR